MNLYEVRSDIQEILDMVRDTKMSICGKDHLFVPIEKRLSQTITKMKDVDEESDYVIVLRPTRFRKETVVGA